MWENPSTQERLQDDHVSFSPTPGLPTTGHRHSPCGQQMGCASFSWAPNTMLFPNQEGFVQVCVRFSQDRRHHEGTHLFVCFFSRGPIFKFLATKKSVLIDPFPLTCITMVNGFQRPTESPLYVYMRLTFSLINGVIESPCCILERFLVSRCIIR